MLVTKQLTVATDFHSMKKKKNKKKNTPTMEVNSYHQQKTPSRVQQKKYVHTDLEKLEGE